MKLFTVAVLLAASVPAAAWANGRFPDAQQLVVDPGDPEHIFVQTTYGFIRTRNGGSSWSWTCESAASYGGVLDPAVALLEGGVMIAGVFDGLVVAEPDGCTMGLVGELEDRFVVDVSRLKSDPAHAIALTSSTPVFGKRWTWPAHGQPLARRCRRSSWHSPSTRRPPTRA